MDPIQERGGKNLYGFVGNNPVSSIDVLGLDYSLCTGIRSASTYDRSLTSRTQQATGALDFFVTYFGFGNYTDFSSQMVNDVVNDSDVKGQLQIWLMQARDKWRCCQSGCFVPPIENEPAYQPNALSTSETDVTWKLTGKWQLLMWGEFTWECGSKDNGKCECKTKGTLHGTLSKNYTLVYPGTGGNPIDIGTSIVAVWPWVQPMNLSLDFSVDGSDSGRTSK
jgi:uncharacterized protein RhaS with RHS repeats